ncbi:glycoside hydrolase, partial [Infundibulicybe gibba]
MIQQRLYLTWPPVHSPTPPRDKLRLNPSIRMRSTSPKLRQGSSHGYSSWWMDGKTYVGRASRPRASLFIISLVIIGSITYLIFIPTGSVRFSSPNIAGQGKNLHEGRLYTADIPKRDAIVSAFQHAWGAYERDAFGSDEYHPIRHQGSNLSKSGGIGYTIVDAIDTMLIMGLHSEYSRARQWIQDELTFEREGNFNVFETTIRVLGGLLSVYHLSSDDLYLQRAIDLAERLSSAFESPSGLPFPSVDLSKRKGLPDTYSPQLVSTAEASTLQLEFRYVAELARNETYWHKVEKVMSLINAAMTDHHLVPIYMSANQGTFLQSEIRLGSRGDSYYEYLLKQYLQTGRTEPIYKTMYQDAMQGIHDHLIQKTINKNMTFIAELLPTRQPSGGVVWTTDPKQDHLVCFLAGSLMLGATTSGALSPKVSIPPKMEELTPHGQRDWKTGVELLETCMYTHQTSTGLSPEIAQFRTSQHAPGESDRDWYIKNSRKGGPSSYDARYMLRPETVESLFIAWRLTGDIHYRQYAWSIFSSIEKHCRLPGGGYATVLDVDTVPVALDDKQETFFLSETLKYLYLTFSDSTVLPLNEYVFNTEAHPLPIFKPTIQPIFS